MTHQSYNYAYIFVHNNFMKDAIVLHALYETLGKRNGQKFTIQVSERSYDEYNIYI
jgi:hypothetical protein